MFNLKTLNPGPSFPQTPQQSLPLGMSPQKGHEVGLGKQGRWDPGSIHVSTAGWSSIHSDLPWCHGTQQSVSSLWIFFPLFISHKADTVLSRRPFIWEKSSWDHPEKEGHPSGTHPHIWLKAPPGVIPLHLGVSTLPAGAAAAHRLGRAWSLWEQPRAPMQSLRRAGLP